MAIKQTAHIIKGLRQDFSDSKQSSEYAIDAKNIRITNREDGTLLSITNEKGPLYKYNFPGTVLGYTVLKDKLIVFETYGIDNYNIYHDYIHLFKGENLEYSCLVNDEELYFSIEHPIESLGVYESEDIQKVYWVDGINQPRVINIAASEEERNSWTNKSFDFIQELKLQETISVEKSYSSGNFSSGVIQYAFNYYNKNGQETNIVDVTPINYISYEDRGAAPNEYVSNSFKITINNVDTNFDYLRLYSIHRTALDATPSVKLVADLKAKDAIEYIDTGSHGELIDPVELLYKGGEWIIPQTLAQKDGTLFFGNIKLKNTSQKLQEKITDLVDTNLITVDANTIVQKTIELPKQGDYYYDYINQLNKDINSFSFFKRGEEYRLGIQFQNIFGKWENPIFIKDFTMNQGINTGKINNTNITAPTILGTLNLSSLEEELKEAEYVKVRPVIVYPNLQNRNILGQGILCPTVFNMYDRHEDLIASQSSWFIRPNSPYDIDKVNSDNVYNYLTLGNSEYAEITEYTTKEASPLSIASNIWKHTFTFEEGSVTQDFSEYGRYTEFRHNKELGYTSYSNGTYSADVYNAEIACTKNIGFHFTDTDFDIKSLWNEGKSSFSVDQSILTFHSPDLEFNKSKITENLQTYKIRLIGIVPITSSTSDVTIMTSTSVAPFYINYAEEVSSSDYSYPEGFIKYTANSFNRFNTSSILGKYLSTANMGWKSLINGPWWWDENVGQRSEGGYNNNYYRTCYVIYPWHTSGSLNNDVENKYSVLKHKLLYNHKFSNNTFYLPNDNQHSLISSDIKFYNTDLDSIFLNAPKGFSKNTIKYSGTVDKIITFNYDPNIAISSMLPTNRSLETIKDLQTSTYKWLDDVWTNLSDTTKDNPIISMKYKTSPHAVISLESTEEENTLFQTILPTIYSSHPNPTGDLAVINNANETLEENAFYLWDTSKKFKGVKQNSLVIDFSSFDDSSAFPNSLNYGWLWLAELYKESEPNKFGNIENNYNVWYPAGEPVDISEINNVSLYWTFGDTFYQRYDHIKTLPISVDDENSILEVISFMCETRINLDGRYDRNRGTSNLSISENNFNLFNDVYNQKDNFFNYRIIDEDIANNINFPNTIVWSKQKFAASDVDAWTNINMTSSLDLDGTKGGITSLNTFNNNIICFQPEGISQILFNSRVQVPTSDGLPIEITNSYKVEGNRYLSSIGCSNKWAIAESPYGLYFMDGITKGVYRFNGQLEDLSTKLGMSTWAKKQDNLSNWTPNSEQFTVHYDKIHKDVYFVNNKECLCFSENLGQFESFFDYENTYFMFNIKDKFYSIKQETILDSDTYLYEMFAGKYNTLSGHADAVPQPFWVTITHNENPFNDKIYNTLEFRSDTWSGDTLLNTSAFNTVKASNEYQDTGEIPLIFNKYIPSNLKRKFRIWRANIPRDSANKRDRIRNTWANITLKANNPGNTKTELHDLVVSYFM